MRHFLIIFSAVLFLSACSKNTVSFLVNETAPLTAPAEYSFDNQSTDCETYEWDFGDGTMSKDSSPSHTYYLSGIYNVTLKGLKDGKSNVITKTIQVKAPEKCLIMIETPYGNMMAELSDKTPLHRDNFTKLAEEEFYNGLLFHRVMNKFMIQGGDPNSRNSPAGSPLGTGGPGYMITAEFKPSLAHVKGALATARTPDGGNPEKKSSGSQFFIVHGKSISADDLIREEQRHGVPYSDVLKKDYLKNGGYPMLDQEYTVFGQVIKGLDVIDKIAQVQTNRQNRPDEDVWMKIRVIK